MLQSVEDTLFIARRMVVFAWEDVGLADNSMLLLGRPKSAEMQLRGDE
jgi:replication-associated recombination protein RarA